MPVKHKIKALLYDIPFTKANPDNNDYIARTISEKSLDVKQICEMAVNRGGADISVDSMVYATSLFLKEMAYQLCDGYYVNTGYFTAGTQIRGVFNSLTETYNADKHKVLFQFSQGEKLRAEIPNIEVDILGKANGGSAILQVIDQYSGSINDRITPRRNLKIKGRQLKIAGDNADNGLFFINANTQVRIAVDANDIIINRALELVILTPDLPAGQYHLELITQYSRSGLLKSSVYAISPYVLTVE